MEVEMSKISNIPQHWKLLTLGEALIESQYGTNAPSDSKGNLWIVGMKDIDGGIIDVRNLNNTSLPLAEVKKYLLKKDDILINRTNSYELVGKVGIFNSNIKAVFASYLVRLVANRNLLLPRFLNIWLNSSTAQKTIKRIATRAISQANINPTELKKHCLIPVPPIAEQEKIVFIFDALEQIIEKTEALINAKQKRFEWINYKLIKNTQGAKRVKLGKLLTESRIPDIKNDPKKRLSVRLHLNGVENREFRGTESDGATQYYIRKAGQLIYGKQNIFRGSIGIVPQKFDGYSSSQDIPAFDIDDSVRTDWLFLYISRPSFYKKLELLSAGSGSKRLHPKELFKITIDLPPLQQQKSIAQTLNRAQNEIKLLKELLRQYQDQKRGLMQRLLTGKVRINNKRESK